MSRLIALLPRRQDYAGLGDHWRGDVLAGVTVAVVALPLALAFGITTGLGAAAGLTTAIVAGLVAAILGGSDVQVSGPTGAMTVVLVPLVARFGADGVVVAGVLAGVLIAAAAILRLGRYLAYIPWPVVEGFTLGIAVIIALQQVPNALGVAKPAGENTAVVAARALDEAVAHPNPPALGLTALVVLVMVVAPRVHRALPSSLLGVLAATVVAAVADLDVATIGALPQRVVHLSVPHLAAGDLDQYLSAAFAIAALAAIESLLSAKVADGMADGRRHDPDRELLGQGVANVVSPLLGGMPATGAIARTAVNVRAGARSRVAAAVHALVLVLVVLFAAPLVAEIPLAALAGVLLVTAARMVDVHNVRAVLRSTRSDAIVLVVTALATVVFDLIVAVEFGVAIAAVLALRHVARTAEAVAVTVDPEVDADVESALLAEHIVTYRLDGALFFGAAQRFLTELTAIADVDVVILRLPGLQVLDATGANALGEIVEDLEDRGITVLLKGPRPEHLRVLEAVGALDRLAHERHLFADLDDAVAHAREHVARGRAGNADHGPPPVGVTRA
ncbi:MAG: SulP family inorganic anion transporter [Acidimicrobiales bacterium]|nr:SulP family inorganic anion transporter [Acidimicrobiales bacterium]MCB1017003.1 SulP family inorganic anion transporter [Acidimicrobiales bacterium]